MDAQLLVLNIITVPDMKFPPVEVVNFFFKFCILSVYVVTTFLPSTNEGPVS